MSILILGGSTSEQQILLMELRSAGYQDLRAAPSAAAVLDGGELANANRWGERVDLILLDCPLTAPDGVTDVPEECRRLRAVEALRDTPIILVTASTEAAPLQPALDAGATDFVAKPLDPAELVARVRIALQLQRTLAKGRRVDELQHAKDTAEAINRARSEFLVSMSHGLRTLLNAIIGYSELLQDEVADRGQENFIPDLQNIRTAGGRLLSLIDNAIAVDIVPALEQLETVTSENAHLLQDVRTRVEELQRARQRVTAVEERQRREIAELLHGSVQTKLLLAWFRLEECKQLLATDPTKAGALIDEVRDEIDRIREREVREASHLLHPSIIRIGLAPAIRSLAGRFRESFRTVVEVDGRLAELDDPLQNRIPERLRLMAYRVVEEALNNVLRHAGASAVEIALGLNAEQCLDVVVQDDGRGFDPDGVQHGLGLSSIADRVYLLGGTWQITSAAGKGTRLSVQLPLASAS